MKKTKKINIRYDFSARMRVAYSDNHLEKHTEGTGISIPWLKTYTTPLSASRNGAVECLAGAQTQTWEPTEEDMKYIREKSQVIFKIRFKEEGTYFDLANFLHAQSITRSLRYAWVIVDLENKSYTEDALSSISEVESWEVLE